jgi:hypothetical protein
MMFVRRLLRGKENGKGKGLLLLTFLFSFLLVIGVISAGGGFVFYTNESAELYCKFNGTLSDECENGSILLWNDTALNKWVTFTSDSGSTTADNNNDVFGVLGTSDGIDTYISGDNVYVRFDPYELPDDRIPESKVKFSTICDSTRKLYVLGDDLACADDKDTTYTADNKYLYLSGTTFYWNESKGNESYVEQNEYPLLDTDYSNDLTTTTAWGGDLIGTGTTPEVKDNSHKHSCHNITDAVSDLCTIQDTTCATQTCNLADDTGYKYTSLDFTGTTGLSDGVDDDTNANTLCSGTTTYLDGEGNCDDISGVYVKTAGGSTVTGANTINSNVKLYFGTSNQAYIYYDSTNSKLVIKVT